HRNRLHDGPAGPRLPVASCRLGAGAGNAQRRPPDRQLPGLEPETLSIARDDSRRQEFRRDQPATAAAHEAARLGKRLPTHPPMPDAADRRRLTGSAAAQPPFFFGRATMASSECEGLRASAVRPYGSRWAWTSLGAAVPKTVLNPLRHLTAGNEAAA